MKMKTTIAATVALAACASTSLFAQNVKEGTITFALTGQQQVSVSETTGANVGYWVDPSNGQGPTHYKTGSARLTQADIIRDIAYVIHGTPGYYGTSAKLVLVQGELSGFFNMTPALSNSIPNTTEGGNLDGTFDSSDLDASTSIANSTESLFTLLASGRHFVTNPINGNYPVGHLQPWGQIYVKWGKGTTNACENVTYFFGITVQECYDCFYLNSFISDSTFAYKTVSHAQSGPPCCTVPTSTELLGSGKDRYYMTFNFDDTLNNPYLNSDYVNYVGVDGISPDLSPVDGVQPDVSGYVNTIKSGIGKPSPYEARFTLNGILTYTWNLKFVNSSDLYPDFVGNASYAANGYGFIALYCTLLNGTLAINETVAKSSLCCDEENGYWYDWWYGTGNYNVYDETSSLSPLNQNAYFDWIGFTPSTPLNTAASLSYHANYNEQYTPFRCYTEM